LTCLKTAGPGSEEPRKIVERIIPRA